MLLGSSGSGLGGKGDSGGALGSFFSQTIDQSLRCNGSNEYLTRTPSSSGNRRTWTYSAWVKLGVDGVRFTPIEAYSNGTNFDMFNIHTDGRILFYTVTSAVDYGGLTTQRLRDPSAWYHIVFRFDSTQSTAADRIRIYINGTQQETTNPFATDYGTLPQNYDSFINHTVPNHIMKNTNSSQYGQGYIAEIHHIDGTSYGPDTFGETKDGVWIPKEVSGVSYGTNGFHLTFADSNYIGRDKSGSKTLVTSPSFSTFGGGDTNFTSAEYAEAADNDLSTGCDRTGNGGIIEFTPSSAVTPTSHTMINASSSAYTAASRPNSVLLQGSNDNGGSWTTIDDLTNGSGANTITTSSFSNTTSYAKLRLNISENHGGSNTRFAQYIVFASDDNGDGENIFFKNNLVASDVVPDSPTNNFAVLNVLDKSIGSPTISEGNLKISGSGSGYDGTYATIAVTSGKWYAEFLYISGDNRGFFGIAREERLPYINSGSYLGNILDTYGLDFRARAYTGTSATSSSGSQLFDQTNFDTGDIGLLCFDVDAGKLWFGRRDVSGSTTIWYDSSGNNNGDPSAGSNPTYTFTATGSTWYIGCHDYAGTGLMANFGQDGSFAGEITSQGVSDANGIGDFNYIEDGFLALCTSNLPDPTIGPGQSEQADDNFNTVLWTGNNSASRGITGVGFQPDFVWTKSRNTTSYHHQFHNSVRGASAGALYPSLTNAEDSSYPISSFDSDGFTTTSGSQNGQNTSHTYVGWFWKAGTAFSNDASATGVGTLDSTGSVNQAAGFSIISYTGTIQSGETIAHGLGGVPEMIWAKNRDNSANWVVYTKDLTSEYTLYFNTSGGENNSATTWGSHTATVFGVDDDPQSNPNGDATIAYLFRSIEGYSKIGSFVGNSSSDGTFVNLGFRPAWVMIKSTSSGTNWSIFDNKRLGYNVDNNIMRIGANESSQEQTDDDVDFVSNGLKFRRSSTNFNNSSHTYIYLAFAEAPFKFANAR